MNSERQEQLEKLADDLQKYGRASGPILHQAACEIRRLFEVEQERDKAVEEAIAALAKLAQCKTALSEAIMALNYAKTHNHQAGRALGLEDTCEFCSEMDHALNTITATLQSLEATEP